MTSADITSVVIPQAALSTAIRTLNTIKGLEACELQPDDSPAEIIVAYLPRHRRGETFMQDFMRAQNDTTHCRIWAASDGSVRVTNDETDAERTYPSLDEAVSALVVSTTFIGRA